jgi:hypothetical protein
MPVSSRVSSIFFCSIFRSCIKIFDLFVELIFVQGERYRSLVSVFWMYIASFLSTMCWRGCLFFSVCLAPLSTSDGCSCVVLFLGLLFCSIGLHVYFCACTMLFVLLLWQLLTDTDHLNKFSLGFSILTKNMKSSFLSPKKIRKPLIYCVLFW